PLSHRAVRRAAARVLRRERRRAALSITFVGPARMRALSARWKGVRRPTDVLTFSLPGPGGTLAGDIYICPAVAAREARTRGIPVREELLRLVVHGTLHALGWEHPEGAARTASPMWRRQERLLEAVR
ncbi:MAG: rRNA maturation RNase YbeY, partial [Gemmatimonadales bacterium]